MSGNIMRRLENNTIFKSAQTVLLYHSLPDEPDTHGFVARHSRCKRILLPVVIGDAALELREYCGEGSLKSGAFSIREPQGRAFADYADIDLAVVPGVAFDSYGNRLGRGKGYYDRLLQTLARYRIPTLGVCFDFQKLDNIPCEPHDIPVDEVL